MCEYCENPNKTIVTHMSGVSAFVGAGHLCLRFYDKESDRTIVTASKIKYCPMCRRKLTQPSTEKEAPMPCNGKKTGGKKPPKK